MSHKLTSVALSVGVERITIPIVFGSLENPVDVWQMRNEFLSLSSERWEERGKWVQRYTHGNMSLERQRNFFQKDFEEWQRLVRRALILPAREWGSGLPEDFDRDKTIEFFRPIPIEMQWQEQPPVGLIRNSDGFRAIANSVKIEKLQGAEFRLCARPDCKEPPFRIEARQKLYCSSDCAHLVAVRRSRARAAAALKKSQSRKHRKAERK